jgi:hypothetical protein
MPDSVTPRPDVIVDFDVRNGILYVALRNIGGASAYEVSTTFEPLLRGLGGQRDISSSRVFRMVTFMPPGKSFEQAVDVFAAFCARKEPMAFHSTLDYRDRDGRRFREEIQHDLRVYADLISIVQAER